MYATWGKGKLQSRPQIKQTHTSLFWEVMWSYWKAFVKVLMLQGNKNAIKYSLHSSKKSIFISESSTWIPGSILYLKKKKKVNANISITKINGFAFVLIFGNAGSLLLVSLSWSGSVWAARCGGFSWRALALKHMGFSSCRSRTLEHRFNSRDECAQLSRAMWDLPRPGIKPVSPAMASRFFTTEPPGTPQVTCVFIFMRGLLQKTHKRVPNWCLYNVPVLDFRRHLYSSTQLYGCIKNWRNCANTSFVETDFIFYLAAISL